MKSPEEIARKYGGVPVESGVDADAIAKKYGGTPVDFARPTNQPQPAPVPTFVQGLKDLGGGAAGMAKDLTAGVGSGVFSTGLSVSKLLGRVPKETTLEDIGMQPRNPTQQVGMAGEQIGEFFLPSGLVSKGAKAVEGVTAASKLPGIVKGAVNLGTRAGLEGLAAGAVTEAQTANSEDAKQSALIAGAIPFLSPVARKVGSKIQATVLGATAADRKAGYSLVNVLKHEVGGTPQDVANKSAAKIQALATDLKAELAKTPQAEVDLLDALAQAQAEVAKGSTNTFGRNTATKAGFDKLLEEIMTVTESGKVDLADAQNVKRSLGLLGSWVSGARDTESKGMEVAANAMYSKLREAIEKTALNGDKVKAINKQLGELIPIEHVAVRRIPAAERQKLVSLSDIVTLAAATHNPANFWMFLANKASTSGKVANMLSRSTGNIAAPAAAAGFVRATRD